MTHKPLLEKIKGNIDRAKIISFDVFDTLLLRPYLEPTDLFLHIEKVKNMSGFCACRTAAEIETRRRNPGREDISFDEIYDEIKDVFKPLKQFELDWEMMVLTPNPEMKQVWDYAKSAGKKIIIAFDMYLPTEFIADALRQNGFGEFKAIYVSGELGKTKASGTMYQHILSEMNVGPNESFHIGDNKRSDYEKPREYKIPSVQYQQLKSQYLRRHNRTNLFSKEFDGNLGVSVFTMLLAMRWQKKLLGLLESNYWDDIGYEYAVVGNDKAMLEQANSGFTEIEQ